MDKSKISLPGLVILRKVGEGAYGQVFLAKRENSGQLIAIKRIPRTSLNKRAVDNLISEISILKSVNHPNIARMLHFNWDNSFVYLHMEYCAGAHALRYLHEMQVVHMDLKPQNILLTSVREPILKLTDFGFAQTNKDTIQSEELRGTLLYMAPEIYCEGIYHPSCDLWSVGVIMHECLFGFPPYVSKTLEGFVEKMKKNEPIQLPSHIPVSAECASLLHGLLQRRPQDRLNHAAFFAHPFVALTTKSPLQAPSTGVSNDDHEQKSTLLLAKARACFKSAAKLDSPNSDCLDQVYQQYVTGLECMMQLLRVETNKKVRLSLRKELETNFDRAEQIKVKLDKQKSNSPPKRPPPPPPPTSPSPKPVDDLIKPVILPTTASVQPADLSQGEEDSEDSDSEFLTNNQPPPPHSSMLAKIKNWLDRSVPPSDAQGSSRPSFCSSSHRREASVGSIESTGSLVMVDGIDSTNRPVVTSPLMIASTSSCSSSSLQPSGQRPQSETNSQQGKDGSLISCHNLDKLRDMCTPDEIEYQNCLSVLSNFYKLLESGDRSHALFYFRSNYDHCLTLAQADTNEARRQAFYEELRFSMNLAERINEKSMANNGGAEDQSTDSGIECVIS